MKNDTKIDRFLWVIPIVLTWVVFWPALNNGLVSDDTVFFDELLSRLTNFSEVWFSTADHTHPTPFYYRPIFYVYLMLTRSFSGYQPWGYHFILLILYTLNTILVYALSLKFFKGKGAAKLGALAAATLFAVHPIHVEVVAWISVTIEALLTLFFLLAFYFFILFRENSQRKLWLILSLCSFLLALLSKETAVIFLIVIVLYDILLFKPSVKKSTSRIVSYVSYVMIFLFYLIMRRINMSHDIFQSFTEVSVTGLFKLFITMGYYLQKILWPHIINPYTTTLPLSTGFVIGSCILLILIVVAAGYTLKHNRLLFFHILFFIVTLLPGMLVALSSVSTLPLAERYLYLPSYGFCFIFGWFMMPREEPVFAEGASRQGGKKFIQAVKMSIWIVILLIGGIVSHDRVKIWRNELTFWSHVAQVNPFHTVPLAMLGRIYLDQNNCPKAVFYLDKAISLKTNNDPKFLSLLYMNKATCHYFMGNYDKAEILIKETIQMNPQPITFYNLGTLYFQMANKNPQKRKQLFGRAKEAFQDAFRLDHKNAEYAYWLAKSYEVLENWDQAERYYQLVLKISNQGEWNQKAQQALDRLK